MMTRVKSRRRAWALIASLPLAAVAALTMAPPLRAAAAPLAAIRVSGSHLVDAGGQAVRLLGVNRSGTDYACEQGWGIFDGPSDAASVQAIASWHANAVRVTLNEQCWLGINGVNPAYGGTNYRAAIVNYVNLLNQNGLYAVLVDNLTGPGPFLSNAVQEMPDADHSPAFWESVASTFKADGGVVFNAYGEPHKGGAAPTQADWECWRSGCAMTSRNTSTGPVPYSWQSAGVQSLVDAIRKTGATQPIMLDGMQWSANFSQWLAEEPADPQHALIASPHMYNFTCASTACWQATLYPTATAVPVVLGETGEDDCARTFIDQFLPWLDARGISYLGWTWDAWNTACNSGSPVLITGYAGTPTAYGQGFKDHLAALATGARPAPSSVVDGSFSTGGADLQSGTIAFPATVQGDLLVVSVGMRSRSGPAPSLVSITDSRGETWHRATVGTPSTSRYSAELWYVPNATAGVTNAVITVTAGASWQGHYQEVSGVSATTTVVDAVSSRASSTSTDVSSGTVTTSAAGEFLAGTIVWDGEVGALTLTSSDWYDDPVQPSVPAEFHAYRAASSPGTFSLAGRMSRPADWVVVIASFKEG